MKGLMAICLAARVAPMPLALTHAIREERPVVTASGEALRAAFIRRSYLCALGVLSTISVGCLIVLGMMITAGTAHAERVCPPVLAHRVR